MTAAEGRIADPSSLPDIIETARQWEQHSRPGEEDPRATLQPRISLLDSTRPAHDLLEDTADELDEQLDTDFNSAVRAEAEANQDRLL